MKKLFVIFVSIVLSSCAPTGQEAHKHDDGTHEHGAQFTQHYDQSLFEITQQGLYSVEMMLKHDTLMVGMNELDVIVHDQNDKDVAGADIVITPWMPSMNHGVMEKPVVTERGGGSYSAENVAVSMPGAWELRVAITKDGLTDTAVFDFPEVHQAGEGHEHHAMQSAPSDLDFSTTRLSENKMFSVTYESRRDPIPMQDIHSWVLKVSTVDGTPVTNAEILVDGDMPEHGHGLPTQPEVLQELEEGTYLVEGMKFSMPGWWTITFVITAGDMQDRVTFNLSL
jgi:hypothetical protein